MTPQQLRSAIDAAPAIHPHILGWNPYVRTVREEDASEDVSEVFVLGTETRIWLGLTPTGRTIIREPSRWLETIAGALGIEGEVAPSTTAARGVALEAALGRCISAVLDAKLSQLMAATVVVIDVIEKGGQK